MKYVFSRNLNMSCKNCKDLIVRILNRILVSPNPGTRSKIRDLIQSQNLQSNLCLLNKIKGFPSDVLPQTSWQGERCKAHLICCDSAKDDSLMMFLKCKSPQRYITCPQFVSNDIKASPPPLRNVSTVALHNKSH